MSILNSSREGAINRLLAALPAKVLRGMAGKLEPVSLRLGEVLCEPHVETTHVYFPLGSLVSLVAVAGTKQLEVGMVGREGMFGFSLALGGGAMPTRALVQGSGAAMRMSAASFRREVTRNRWLMQGASRCAHNSMATAMQVAACNNAHLLLQRFARWLLMTSDCTGQSSFFLTQEFLALMVGVRRTGVSEAAGILQRRGIIAYRRGSITILKRGELEDVSCGCYAVIRGMSRT